MSSVYRRVPEECLVKWQNTSREDAEFYASYDTVHELENGSNKHDGVYSLSSIRAGLRSITRQLHLSDTVYDFFEFAVIHDDDGINEIFDYIGDRLKTVKNIDEFILTALADIHDKWVLDNSFEKAYLRKFKKHQLYQYTPIELIGWNELLSDLLFLEPILNCIGVNVDRDRLRKYYNEKILRYAEEHSITSKEDLATLVSTGSAYYPILPEELATKLSENSELVSKQIVNNLVKDNSPLLEVIGYQKQEKIPILV